MDSGEVERWGEHRAGPHRKEKDGWDLVLIWLYALVFCTVALLWIGSW
jgi:hypothetical protein